MKCKPMASLFALAIGVGMLAVFWVPLIIAGPRIVAEGIREVIASSDFPGGRGGAWLLLAFVAMLPFAGGMLVLASFLSLRKKWQNRA